MTPAPEQTPIEMACDLVKGRQAHEVLSLLFEATVLMQSEEEAGKDHPLKAFSLPAKEFDALAAHALDGGGVTDDSSVCVDLINALVKRDQIVFWPSLVHLLKSLLKQRGYVEPIPGSPGAVQIRGMLQDKPLIAPMSIEATVVK